MFSLQSLSLILNVSVVNIDKRTIPHIANLASQPPQPPPSAGPGSSGQCSQQRLQP